MAWIFVSKAKMNYFVNGDSSTVIKNAILDSLVLQSDALDSWNQSSMNINISTDKVISYGNIVARRNGIVQTRASSNGAVSYGVDGAFWMHFYNEGNNWYYRAFTGTVSGSEYIDYTQLTQSYDIAIYSGFAINESLHRAALLTLTVNESNNSKIELNAYFKRPSISFDDFYTEIKSVILTYTSNGGGATHIAKVTGQLKDLSSNLSDILMVSGGGGGGYLTGVPGWDGHEIEILTSGENRTLTAQRSNNTLTFKLFTSGTEIYSFSPAVSDLSKINLSFIADLENEVAKPSLIYDVGSDSYSYNQEAPTDEEMADIFTWLDGSLPYVHVYHGYKADNSPELYWATSQNITIDAPSRESLSVWKAYIVVIHRQAVTLPEGWTLLDTRINRSGWQYVSVYTKVVTQSETVTVSQESQNALSLMSFYTDQYNTVVYDDEYYGDSADPMNWVLPAADYPRIFAFSLGYTTDDGVTTKSVAYSPALNGWQEPNIFSSANNYRSMLFYMTGEETSTTTLTYNGFSATGQWAEDKANSSQIVAYKVIYYRV